MLSSNNSKEGVLRAFDSRVTLTERGLDIGGTSLAKMGDEGLCFDDEEERILTLLAIAYDGTVPRNALGALRRVSKHWQSGDKCLAAIHLAQCGLGKLDAEATYRVSLAAKLLDAGVTPRELARELGLRLFQLDVSKYDENQPRVPAGSGRTSGQWTSSEAGGNAAEEDGVNAAESTLTEGRSAAAHADAINKERDLPKDAVVVKRPDGTKIDDPYSKKTGKLMAPPRANFREVYAAGTKVTTPFQIDSAIGHFGRFDFQRDKATNTFYPAYTNASNYAVGVFMAGAGYTREHTHDISETFAYL